jgi:Arc/MetJ family transcription regulator
MLILHIMRTNIEIDDKLMVQAMRVTGEKTKKGAVDQGLRALVRLAAQGDIRKLRGKVEWDGDLKKMRAMRFPNQQW